MQSKPRTLFFISSSIPWRSRTQGRWVIGFSNLVDCGDWLMVFVIDGVMVVVLWSIGDWVVAVWLAWVIGFVGGPFVLLRWAGWKRLSWNRGDERRPLGRMFWLMVLRPCPKIQSASFIFHGCNFMLMNFNMDLVLVLIWENVWITTFAHVASCECRSKSYEFTTLSLMTCHVSKLWQKLWS